MTKRVGVLLGSLLVAFFCLSGLGNAAKLTLNCEASSPHYIGFLDDKMYWTCDFNSTNSYSCWSYVWLPDKSQLLQTNPERIIIQDVGVVDSFDSSHGFVNVYFTGKNLIVDNAFTYVVKCSDNSSNNGTYEMNLTTEYMKPYNVVSVYVWVAQNSTYIVGGFLGMLVIIAVGFFLYKQGKGMG